LICPISLVAQNNNTNDSTLTKQFIIGNDTLSFDKFVKEKIFIKFLEVTEEDWNKATIDEKIVAFNQWLDDKRTEPIRVKDKAELAKERAKTIEMIKDAISKGIDMTEEIKKMNLTNEELEKIGIKK